MAHETNENKSTHITFSLKHATCPAVTLYAQHIPQRETVTAEINNLSTKYRKKPITYPNELIPFLLEDEVPRKLKYFKPTELTTRFA